MATAKRKTSTRSKEKSTAAAVKPATPSSGFKPEMPAAKPAVTAFQAAAPAAQPSATVSSFTPPVNKIRRHDIPVRWIKITEQEALSLNSKVELIALVQAKYGLAPDLAQREVESWLNGRAL